MAHLTNFSFEFFYKIFTEDASRPLLYHGAKTSKMTKNSNQGGGSCLNSLGVLTTLTLGGKEFTELLLIHVGFGANVAQRGLCIGSPLKYLIWSYSVG